MAQFYAHIRIRIDKEDTIKQAVDVAQKVANHINHDSCFTIPAIVVEVAEIDD